MKCIRLDLDYYAVYPDFVDAHLKISEAKKNLEKLIKENPDNAAAHYGMAYIYKKESQWEKQIAESRRAVELKPDLLEARNLVSGAYYSMGKYHDALNACNVGLKVSL